MKQFTKREIAKIINYVNEAGTRRGKAQGERFSDVDFVCGAMSVFFALDLQENIPATWIFNARLNQPVFRQGESKK